MCTVPRTATHAAPADLAMLTASSIARVSATGPGAESASTIAIAGRSTSTVSFGRALAWPLANSSR